MYYLHAALFKGQLVLILLLIRTAVRVDSRPSLSVFFAGFFFHFAFAVLLIRRCAIR